MISKRVSPQPFVPQILGVFYVIAALSAAVVNAGIYGGHGGGSGINDHELHHAEQHFQHLGSFVGKHHLPPKEIRITKTLAVKVPQPYPVKVPHPVPYPVKVVKHVPVHVPKVITVHEQVPVPVPKPYPVPVYKHESQAPQTQQHQEQVAASYSAPVQSYQHNDHQQAQYNYFKDSGKYTSPVFDISAFHPTVMNKGQSQQFQHEAPAHTGYQSFDGHQQSSFGGQEQSFSGHQIESLQSYSHQPQPTPEYHQQAQSQGGYGSSATGHEGYQAATSSASLSGGYQQYDQHTQFGGEGQGVKQETYLPPTASTHDAQEYAQFDQHSQIGGQPEQDISGKHAGGEPEDYSQYNSAASAGQEQAFNQKQLDEYSSALNQHHSEEGHQQVQQEQHVEQQSQHESAPAQPAAHTYSFFRLGNHQHEVSSSHDFSGHSSGQQHGQIQQSHQIEIPQYHSQPQQQPQEYHHHEEVEAPKAPEIGHFQHNIGQSVLKEVQGPQLGGHSHGHGQDFKSRPIYIPHSSSSHSYKARPAVYLPPHQGHYRGHY